MESTTPHRPERATLERAIAHLVRLVDVDSTSGREAAGVDMAERIVSELGLACRRMPVEEGRDNLLVGSAAPALVLCTHLDTVPPFIPASRDGDVVHGRGSADAKGIAVAMLYALTDLKARKPELAARVGVWLVVGEETDHAGAHAAAESDLRPEWIILGEPCGTSPTLGQKGMLKLNLEAVGTAGHSAYPDVGQSAIHRLLDALAAIRDTPLPGSEALGETTVNVGELAGGLAPNVIAPSASATIMCRCAAAVDDILNAITARLPEGVTASEFGRQEPLRFEGVGALARGAAVPFNTDGGILSSLGAKLVLFGPGDMRCAHSDREHLTAVDLAAGIAAYAEAVETLLGDAV